MSDQPSKKEQLLKLLERGSVFVHLDPRRDGVFVPPWLNKKPQLVLQLGLNFAIPIPDLVVDDFGVRCTLSFNRSPFPCTLPWNAVYALVAEDGQVTVWPTELPAELVPQPLPVRKERPSPRGSRADRTRPRISVVPALPETPAPRIAAEPNPGASRDERANDSMSLLPPPSPRAKTPAAPRERPPYLRLIK